MIKKIFQYPLIGNIIAFIVNIYYFASSNKFSNNIYKVKVFPVNKLIPSFASAITYGNNIFIRIDIFQSKLKDNTLKHEMIHVDQWHRYGFFGFGFLFLYLFYYIKYGYKKSPLEIEAYAAEIP